MSINYTSRSEFTGTQLSKSFKKKCQREGKKSNPPYVKLCTGRGTTGCFYSCLHGGNALRALHESCIPCPAAKIEPQAALFPSHDIAVEPTAFLRKLVMTGSWQGRLGGNNGPQSGGRARWRRPVCVSTRESSSGIQVGEQEWTRLGEM